MVRTAKECEESRSDVPPRRIGWLNIFHKKDTAFSEKINSNGEKKRKKHVRGLKTAPNDAKFLSEIVLKRTSRSGPPARPFHCTTMESALAKQVYDKLLSVYGPQKCFLEHMTPFQLLVATILSAQCTDKRVNMVTRELFKRWPDAVAFASCGRDELEQAIFTCGFYHAKAGHIIEASKAIVEQFHGEIPDTMEGLLKLPGVGRKTANVVLGDAMGKPGFPVDTHVRRLSGLIGLSKSADPAVIESDICAVMPPETWAQFSHLLIVHGRTRCPANRPDCPGCELARLCGRANAAKTAKTGGKKAKPNAKAAKKTAKAAKSASARGSAKLAAKPAEKKTATRRKTGKISS